jgi:hypothetical protein
LILAQRERQVFRGQLERKVQLVSRDPQVHKEPQVLKGLQESKVQREPLAELLVLQVQQVLPVHRGPQVQDPQEPQDRKVLREQQDPPDLLAQQVLVRPELQDLLEVLAQQVLQVLQAQQGQVDLLEQLVRQEAQERVH